MLVILSIFKDNSFCYNEPRWVGIFRPTIQIWSRPETLDIVSNQNAIKEFLILTQIIG